MKPYDRALQSLWLQPGDALALAREAVAAAPESVAARLLEANLLVSSRDVRDFEAAGWAFARLQRLSMNARERAHAAALAAAIDADLERVCAIHDQILAGDPDDALALWVACLMDYYVGNSEALRARTGRVLARLSPDAPGYHAVLSMHAFGLEECGDYAAAEDAALRALELEPRDLRAQHALLHVYEMLGKPQEGLRWAAGQAANWTHHMWWHVGLFFLALDRPHAALAICDTKLGGDSLAELIDASALLWRLRLARADVGPRFAALAGRWAAHAEDAHCAFNDLHAMMAFAGAERWDLAHRLLAAQERRLQDRRGANHHMTRLVGYPACRALYAFARGEYRTAEALLRSLPPVAHRIGGSHAQRDILTLTRAAAVTRRPQLPHGEIHAPFLSQSLAAA